VISDEDDLFRLLRFGYRLQKVSLNANKKIL